MATGVINGFNSEPRTSKAGKRYTAHLINIDGMWYEAGFNKPAGVGVGDTVDFDSEVKYGKQQASNIRRAGSPAAPVTAASAPPKAPGTSGGRPDYGPKKEFPVPLLHPDRSIIRQNALAHATKLYELHALTTKVAVTDGEAAAEAIIQLAYKFEEYASGHREVRMSEDKSE